MIKLATLHNIFCEYTRQYRISNVMAMRVYSSLTLKGLIPENTPKIICMGPLITEKRSFKKSKILSLFARFISKIEKLAFSIFISQIFWQTFFVSKNLKCEGQLLWKLPAVELAILFHWTKLRTT